MYQLDKLEYLVHVLTKNQSELFRLLDIGLTTAKFRYLRRCVGKGTMIESQTRIINSTNVRIGENCLIKEGTYIRAGIEGKVIIKDRVAINAFCRIFGHGSVEIGEDTQLGPCTLITTTVHDYHNDLRTRFEPVKIGNCVWVGANATVLPGVTIGDHSVIGAGAVVISQIPARSIAVGVPAKVIKQIEGDRQGHNSRQDGTSGERPIEI